MSKLSTWVILGASWALWLGCLYDPYDSDEGVGGAGDYVVEDAWLSGELPEVGAFDADAYEVELGYDDVTVHVGARGGQDFGWAMTRLGLSVGELHATSGTVEARYATGCAGPRHGRWDWDHTTSDVRVTVQPGAYERDRVVHFTAEFGDGQRTEGGFTVRPR